MEYLKWEKEMAETFNLKMFADYHNLDVIICLFSFSPTWDKILMEEMYYSTVALIWRLIKLKTWKNTAIIIYTILKFGCKGSGKDTQTSIQSLPI